MKLSCFIYILEQRAFFERDKSNSALTVRRYLLALKVERPRLVGALNLSALCGAAFTDRLFSVF